MASHGCVQVYRDIGLQCMSSQWAWFAWPDRLFTFGQLGTLHCIRVCMSLLLASSPPELLAHFHFQPLNPLQQAAAAAVSQQRVCTVLVQVVQSCCSRVCECDYIAMNTNEAGQDQHV